MVSISYCAGRGNKRTIAAVDEEDDGTGKRYTNGPPDIAITKYKLLFSEIESFSMAVIGKTRSKNWPVTGRMISN